VTTLDDIPVNFGANHNHPANHAGLAASAFVNELKDRCREEVRPIPTLYNEEIAKLLNRDFDDSDADVIRQIPTFYSCRTALYHSRAKVMPKLPKSQADIELEGQWTETSTGERFLLCDDTNAQGHRIVIFATNDNIRQMCNSTLLLCDGTFYTCPGLFSQLYTVHITKCSS
jgi:hypothetical protein